MKIAVDGRTLYEPHKSGVENYVYATLTRMLNMAHDHEFILLTDRAAGIDPAILAQTTVQIVPASPLWSKGALSYEFWRHRRRYDVFFSPLFTLPIIPARHSVITLYDLGYVKFPQYFPWFDRLRHGVFTRHAVHYADRILAISESTKRDIMEIYHYPAEHIVVTPLAYDSDLFRAELPTSEITGVRQKYRLHTYVLFTGTLQGRKGIDILLQAFDRVWEATGGRLELALVGKRGWSDAEIYRIYEQMRHKDAVKFLGYVPDDDLAKLYAGAEMFVLPSRYEGFGIPILEAMACGAPVITTRVSSLPEAGGEAACYTKVGDVEGLAEAMTTVLGDRARRTHMVAAGLAQAKKFSWDKTAALTLETLEKAVL